MRKLALFVGALGLIAAVVPAHAETSNWATYAVASSQYSNGQAGGLLGPVFSLSGVVEGAVGPAITLAEPALDYVLCTLFSESLCLPDDPAALASEIAERAGGFPDDLEEFLSAFPAELQAAVEAFPGNVQDAATTTPNNVIYGNWAAMQATGAPNTYPSCGDIATAWAPQPSGGDPEVLAVFYDPPVSDATGIEIYETNIGGFVTSVEVILATGESILVFSGPDTTSCPGILSIPLSAGPAVAGVIIHTQAPGWEEIDAVAVVN